jgi:hypothetical protein
MSISAMTNVAFARRVDVPPLGNAPANVGEADQAAGGTPDSRSPMTSTISAITRYIPTEVLTLYVAALGAVHPSQNPQPTPEELTASLKATPAEWIAFGFFLLATPLVVWLLYAAKVLNSNSGIAATDKKKLLPLAPWKWPVWEMVAATIGYAAWAFALPNSPFRDFTAAGFYSQALAGVIVLVVSTILGLIAPVVCGTLPE